MYLASYITRPLRLFKSYHRADLVPDLVAGISVGVVLLPQAIAFTLIAQLPPEMGLYAACVGAIVAALWGSSNQIQTGPVNTTSLLVASMLLSLATPGTPRYIIAAGLLALMSGSFQLVLGFARLGMLVNFVSYSVVVGFSTGSGILIILSQLRPLLGLPAANSQNVLDGLYRTLEQLPALHVPTAAIGVGTFLLILLLNRINRRLPASVISLVIASTFVILLGQGRLNVRVIGSLPRGLPPLANLPLFDLNQIASLSTGALALGALGLIQTAAVSRSIAAQTRQKPDNNQEFVGQGLANIASAFLSGYPVSASFSRSGFNLQSGARSPLASIFSGLFLLIILLTLAPLAALLPLAAVSSVLILAAINLIDRKELIRIWRGSHAEALIMLITLLGTLFLRLDFAVLTGILLSFALYIKNTSNPRVTAVVPDENFRHLSYQAGKPLCPQLVIFDILGDLYFGAVNHIEDKIKDHMARNPTQRFMLLRMQNVSNCDISGILMLESIVQAYRQKGGDVYMVRVRDPVLDVMTATGFNQYLGKDHFLIPDDAISFLFHKVLDPAVCVYESNVRVFRECQALARPDFTVKIPTIEIPRVEILSLDPRSLWAYLHGANPPLVVDVREPREYQKGHIPKARLIPLPRLIQEPLDLPKEQQIVFICRSGRRSLIAAQFLYSKGYQNATILNGGMLAWETEGLLEAEENGIS